MKSLAFMIGDYMTTDWAQRPIIVGVHPDATVDVTNDRVSFSLFWSFDVGKTIINKAAQFSISPAGLTDPPDPIQVDWNVFEPSGHLHVAYLTIVVNELFVLQETTVIHPTIVVTGESPHVENVFLRREAPQ